MERKNWKYTYSAVNRDLIEYISKNSIDEIYLCGFDTDGCILKTAFDLFENNKHIYYKTIAWAVVEKNIITKQLIF